MIINRVHLGFFFLGSHLFMQDLHQNLHNSCISPLFVMPVDGRVGWEVFGQVLPIASILEAIEDAIENIPIAPLERACPFL